MASPIGSPAAPPPSAGPVLVGCLVQTSLGAKYHIPYWNILTRIFRKEQKEEYSLKTTYREPEVAFIHRPHPNDASPPSLRLDTRGDEMHAHGHKSSSTHSCRHTHTHTHTLLAYALMHACSVPLLLVSSSKRRSQGGFFTHMKASRGFLQYE